MEYDILLRYELQVDYMSSQWLHRLLRVVCYGCTHVRLCVLKMPRDWEEVRVMVIRPGPIPTSSPCGNTIPADDLLTISLPSAARSVKHVYKCFKGQSIQVSKLTFCHHLVTLMLFFRSSVDYNKIYFEECFYLFILLFIFYFFQTRNKVLQVWNVMRVINWCT